MSTVWNKADLHLHSMYSDGADDLRTILAYTAKYTDLRVIAITDHDHLDGALDAQRLAPHYGLEVIPGQEVTTRRGHVLALFVREFVSPGLSIPETVACIHQQGGLAILAHPFDRICNSPMRHYPRPTFADWLSFGADGLEAINGCQVDPLANPRSASLGRRLRLAATGGSDAHHKEVIGHAYTLFPGTTAADLRRALEQHTCLAAGQRWSVRGYWGWLVRSFLPHTLHLPRPGAHVEGEVLGPRSLGVLELP